MGNVAHLLNLSCGYAKGGNRLSNADWLDDLVTQFRRMGNVAHLLNLSCGYAKSGNRLSKAN